MQISTDQTDQAVAHGSIPLASFVGVPVENGQLILTGKAYAAGIAIRFTNTAALARVADRLDPSFLLKRIEADTIVAVYLVADEDGHEELCADLISAFPPDEAAGILGASESSPLPGDEWLLHPEDEEALEAGEIVRHSVAAIEDAFFAPEPIEEDAPEMFQDAEVMDGDRLDDEFLKGEITIGYGSNRQAKRWKNTPLARVDLLHKLCEHVAGQKDGPCILQGETGTGERLKAAMTTMHIVGLDVDCGLPMEKVIARLSELGLMALVYTTHSHLGTETEISESKYLQYARKHNLDDEPTPESAGRFLRDVRHYTKEINSTAYLIGTSPTTPGNLLIGHAPMERYRIILFLAEPYVFAAQKHVINNQIRKMTIPEAQTRWKGKLLGLSEMLQVPIDQSCTEPARLFYLPRHKADTAFRIVLIGGKPLEFDKVPEHRPGREDVATDVFERAAAEMGARNAGEFTLRSGTGLKEWAKHFADGFQITAVFEEHAPDDVRTRVSPGKWEVKCPFDDEHSNPGDPEDRGTFICDGASEESSGGGFVWRCQHNACAGRDRLHMLKKAIDDGMFPESVLSEKAFNDVVMSDADILAEDEAAREEERARKAAEHEERREKLERIIEVKQAIAGFGKDTTSDEITAALKMLWKNGADFLAIKEQVNIICKKLKSFTANDLMSVVKGFEKQKKEHQEDGRKSYEQELLEFTQSYRGILDPNHDIILIDLLDYIERRDKVIELFNKRNMESPNVFRFAGERIRATVLKNGQVEMSPMSRPVMRDSFLKNVTLFDRKEEEGYRYRVALPDQLSDDLIASENVDLPDLEGFMTQPYYTQAADLITTPGYNSDSKIIFRAPKTYAAPSLPKTVSVEQARDSLSYLRERVFRDFPFDDGPDAESDGEASWAHFVSMILVPIVRPMLLGDVPFMLITKPRMGVGAGYLVKAAIRISTGEAAQAQVLSNHDEEVRKAITSYFKTGKQYVWFDNPTTRIDSEPLMVLGTAEVWTDRSLGENTIVSYPNRMMTVISGNNVALHADMTRRVLPIRIDSRTDPLKRDKSKFVIQGHFPTWVQHNQPELFKHALTIVEGWKSAGCPLWHERSLPSFEGFSETMGGILDVAGASEHFLNNLHLTLAVNENETTWAPIYSAWYAKHGFNQISPKQATETYCDMENPPSLPKIYRLDVVEEVMPRFIPLLKGQKDATYDIVTPEGRTLHVAVRHDYENKAPVYHLEEVTPR